MESRYRIVFRGEVGLGYDHSEIRENLSRLTRWDAKKIDLLLASEHCVVKSDLDLAAADRMISALNNTGIICQRERLPEANSSEKGSDPSATIAVVGRTTIAVEDATANNCPKCGQPRDGGLSCPACGIIFAKFGQARESVVSKAVPASKVVSSHTASAQRSSKRREDPLSQLEGSHPLGYYLGRLVLVIAGVFLLRTLYRADLTLLILILLPISFVIYLGALSSVTERPFGEILSGHLSLLPIPSSGRDRRVGSLPYATYGLLLLNVVLYLGFQLPTPIEILQKKWFFLPTDSTPAHLFMSAFASLFMHTSGFAFFGAGLFLWIIGATLERRIGSGMVIAFYLLCGLLAAGVGVGVQQFLSGEPQQIIGAGGAIAGLFGAFVIRSHSRNMIFPLPFFGIDALVSGTPYLVRWSSLLIAALVVLADLNAPLAAAGGGHGALGAVILLGGFLSGMLAAHLLDFGNEADDEEDEAGAGSQVFTANEKTLRKRLETNPDDPELLVQLARVISEEGLTDEARQLYRRAIINRITSRPKEATEIYREFNLRYQEVFEPKLTMRLASLYLRQGDQEMTANALHSVCDDERATPQEREKALFQYCATIVKLGELEEGYMMLKRFANDFPESVMLQKLRDIVYDAAQGEQK